MATHPAATVSMNWLVCRRAWQARRSVPACGALVIRPEVRASLLVHVVKAAAAPVLHAHNAWVLLMVHHLRSASSSTYTTKHTYTHTPRPTASCSAAVGPTLVGPWCVQQRSQQLGTHAPLNLFAHDMTAGDR